MPLGTPPPGYVNPLGKHDPVLPAAFTNPPAQPQTLGGAAQGALATQAGTPQPTWNPDEHAKNATATNWSPFGFLPNAGSVGSAPAAPGPDRDLTQPGAAEQFYADNGSWFTQPTNSQGAYDQYNPLFGQLSQQAGPAYAAQVFTDFQKTPQSAGLDPYYKNAWNDTSERLNRELAARGEFNSGAAIDTMRRASVGLGAEQANREADYALRRSQVGGNLAGAASGEELAGRAAQLSAASTGANLAGDADSANLSKMGAGVGAASVAQNAREGRIRGAYDDVSGAANQQAGLLTQTMEANLAAHAELQGMPFELQMALAQAQINGDQAQANNILGLASSLIGAGA